MDLKNFNYLEYNLSKSSNVEETNKPRLVAPGVKYFFKSILNECHKAKCANYNLFYNIAMGFLFFTILFIILYSKYKGGLTSKESYEKSLKDKQYIMSKLVYYNRQNLVDQQKIRNNMITNLPDFSNHPEAHNLHKKIYFS